MADITRWETIKDFSPGIFQRVSPNHPVGAAQDSATFRCCSQESGALVPLPKLTNRYYHDVDLLSPGATLLSEEYRITGIYVNDPVFWDDNGTGIYQNNSEIYVAFEHWEDDGGTEQQVLTVERYKRNFDTTPTWERIDTRIYTQDFDNKIRPKRCEFVALRSNPSDELEAGPIVICWVYAGWAQAFPDPANPTISGTVYMPGDNVDDAAAALAGVGVDGLLAHQGRAVIFPLSVLAVGDDQLYTTNEAFYWMKVNDVQEMDTTYSSGYFKAITSYDNPTGYQVYQSMTADELLLIKARGGAIVVSGNLNDFRVRNLPNVRGTGHSMNRGTPSPGGFVYPVDGGGVWRWGGGDQSESLTRHMETDFWRPNPVSPAKAAEPDENLWGYQYSKCALWGEYVMFPNNWLWDTDFGGWWQLDDREDFVIHKWDADWRQLLCYGTPSGFTDDENTPVLYEFNKVVLSDTYSWFSHPLPFSQERRTTIAAAQLVATGTGTVAITIASAEDPSGQTYTWNVAELSTPDLTETRFNLHGTHFTVLIEADSGDPDIPAPTVHEVRLGVIDHTQVERVV